MHAADTGRHAAPDDVVPAWPEREPRWRVVVRSIGELLVTGGLVVLLFVVYELFVTDLLNGERQEDLNQQVRTEWEADPPEPGSQVPGDAIAVLHIPRLGADYQRVVLEGTAYADLKDGPGHYLGTALPGQPGNVAIAGHRTTYGSPFRELDLLQPGDPIVVETADDWFVYRVLGDPATGDVDADPSGIPGRQIVRPEDVDVISPTPNAAATAPPTGAYLTLTTCHPRYSAQQRLIIHARLDGTAITKAQMPNGPAALQER